MLRKEYILSRDELYKEIAQQITHGSSNTGYT